MKNLLKTIKAVLLVFAFISTTSLMAQGPQGPPAFGSGDDSDNVIDNNQGVPLDGGIAALIIGAAAFGIKKLRDNSKK
ncbi:hypothetical protein FPF71_01780 [Algibacter amylolyticus]|uniref:Uncharacterized protein n=1 Tax=Algibacter amylolyticus TaxID=1608400 RepID=A0A5M7BGP8_9FLAO|nr:hypothetical protein [Algibacter amylolyticus]KAA5827597.1 hypothetical protein F2B50_01780 [Algibacter amylolyticus]MBB5266805.1 hypothetical protein [Algibacter amylolyticus]TSJ81842.1 hypothetical protein FPF71_01780 [Algibacter amylolyticus]